MFNCKQKFIRRLGLESTVSRKSCGKVTLIPLISFDFRKAGFLILTHLGYNQGSKGLGGPYVPLLWFFFTLTPWKFKKISFPQNAFFIFFTNENLCLGKLLHAFTWWQQMFFRIALFAPKKRVSKNLRNKSVATHIHIW